MKGKNPVSTQRDGVAKKDLQAFKNEIIQQFHIISEGLIDQIKLQAKAILGLYSGLTELKGKINMSTWKPGGLIKISFSQLDRRISGLESQMKEVQESKKQVQARFQV